MSSEFKKRMDHDIRTPMNAIIGYADLATRHLQETEKLGKYLKKIQICGIELLSMLGNVLDLARIGNNKVEMEYAVSNVHFSSFMNFSNPESIDAVISILQRAKYINPELFMIIQGEFFYQAKSWEYPRRVVCINEKTADQYHSFETAEDFRKGRTFSKIYNIQAL